ncbi:hypothetical protein IAQ61_008984 [Plenodomus lingam]|uniref:Zinc finger PHD-type domain-containing protein n=1 Tax=Leptosphaeria maculans (strain JN3 / isolate v23.1.3 / race Av1-4-5-6-7-8) TaxID=985895 RepID=E4ZNQ2_LEPMJ|nr:hypothetical protein LEMA_P041720.1 [Plenodomus lingam JN3]KAH9865038.1 hypothetical protein IAQ61_008984 [Plenodomus lingam]CBX93271.1 hypothetical protein LEMA_P041720.1 [Plenodomus lingam JN3]
MKRKLSISPSPSNERDGKQVATLQSQPAEPATGYLTQPPTYGVYQHNILEGSGQEGAKLITTSKTRDDAHDFMRNHALLLINANPRWGATEEHTTYNIYEILDSKHYIQLRYDISPIHFTDFDEVGDPLWQRGAAPMVAPRHYGIYFSLHPKDGEDVETKKQFSGGYTCLGEASHAMTLSARAFLAKHSGSKAEERSLELLDDAGRLAQKYWIEEGRLVDGVFMQEEEWEAMLDQRDEGMYVPPVIKGKRHSVLRMPTPELPMGRKGPENDHVEVHNAEPAQLTPPPDISAQEGEKEEDGDPTKPWCSCRQPDDGLLMICCANEDKCPVKWYHARCLGIRDAPEDWLCPECDPTTKGAKKTAVKKRVKKTVGRKVANKTAAKKMADNPATQKKGNDGRVAMKKSKSG